MQIFGFSIKRKKEEQQSFAPPQLDDGAIVALPTQQTGPVGGAYGTALDLDGSARTEAELVNKYRQMALTPEIRQAIDHVVNEAIVVEKEQPIVKIDMEHADVPSSVSKAIQREFEEVLRLLEFKTKAYDIFRAWYVDGRLPYHVIIDPQNIGNGISELRWIDPRKLKKFREVQQSKPVNQGGAVLHKTQGEYYVYNPRGFDGQAKTASQMTAGEQGVKIGSGSIVYLTSGLLDETGTMVLSYLHDAIRNLNMFKTMQDSAIIYRLVRAPQRRVFYIDVGDLPKHKAEQYVNDMMTKYKNKLVYDPSTGTMRDDRKHMTMLEDFWLSRREGGRGTEIDTLDGAANWGVMDEVMFFLKQLYKTLHVPLARLDPEMLMPLGRNNEISREEVDFSKFVDRIRTKFCELFIELLHRQLILKNIVTPEDWEELRPQIDFHWCRDNYFAELKELAVLNERFNALTAVQPFVGQFVSNEWVRKKVLFQTQDEYDEINEQILAERDDPLYMVQTGPDGMPAAAQPGMSLPPGSPAMMDAEAQAQDQQDAHDQEKQDLEGAHADELQTLTDKHGQVVDDMKDKLKDASGKSEAGKAAAKGDANTAKAAAKGEQGVAKAKEKHAADTDKHKEKHAELKDKHAEQIDKLKDKHSSEKEKLKDKHDDLRHQTRELKIKLARAKPRPSAKPKGK